MRVTLPYCIAFPHPTEDLRTPHRQLPQLPWQQASKTALVVPDDYHLNYHRRDGPHMLSDNRLNDFQVRKEGCLTWAAMPNRCAGHRKAVGPKAVRYITYLAFSQVATQQLQYYHPSMMTDRTPIALHSRLCIIDNPHPSRIICSLDRDLVA